MGCGKRDDVGGIRTDNCVCEVVRAIKDIQDAAVADDCLDCTTSCFLEPLGDLNSPAMRRRADTRVFTLTNKNGELFKALFKQKDGQCDANCVTIYFRVEEIFDNCCATLRALRPNKDIINDYGKLDYGAICKVDEWFRTNNCITVDLNCFCAIQCIADVDLDICE
ncbi:spore coat protein CotZ [Rossellomorea vietnamensis]|uniref:Spore coat protein CotZ n=2 Tax=Rossellomorea TaxID=2837508 RepID=A0A5D4KLW7_9BACI|nr:MULTISPECIES: CotY/CotZ family spore coat protein [Rossellomorea]TYR77776.1 spore coat protein CotZ [Rossellomorea vietnamensis]TYS83393.1 spore coat protein CotZ [Rossellomorea aquimaris]